MNKMIYHGQVVDGDTFHPPYAPDGLTLAECQAIDKRLAEGDVEFTKLGMSALEDKIGGDDE